MDSSIFFENLPLYIWEAEVPVFGTKKKHICIFV